MANNCSSRLKSQHSLSDSKILSTVLIHNQHFWSHQTSLLHHTAQIRPAKLPLALSPAFARPRIWGSIVYGQRLLRLPMWSTDSGLTDRCSGLQRWTCKYSALTCPSSQASRPQPKVTPLGLSRRNALTCQNENMLNPALPLTLMSLGRMAATTFRRVAGSLKFPVRHSHTHMRTVMFTGR